MPALSAKDLEYMQDTIESELLDQTCNILSPTLATDGAGGMTETWGTASASVDCRLDAKAFSESTFGATNQPFFGYMLTLAHDATIASNYRVEVGGDTFNVISVDSEKSWDACIRCYLERL